ncbi:hypothetical protein FHS14_006533 [Paenibacillus baekrokdamisoli]|nr:hypothetical protein [Paenibacillus baekrokdamisoli]
MNNEEYRKQLEITLKRTDIPNSIDMDAVIRTTHSVSHLLLGMNWCLMTASEGSCFVTSDNPVVVADPNNQEMVFTGFNSPNVQVTFPLSPVVCLLGGWEDRLPLIWNVDTLTVNRINSMTLRNSQRYIFSSSREVETLF